MDFETNPHCNNSLELNVQPGIFYFWWVAWNVQFPWLEQSWKIYPPRRAKIYQSQSGLKLFEDHCSSFPNGNQRTIEPLEPTTSFRNVPTTTLDAVKLSSFTVIQTTRGWTWSTQTCSCENMALRRDGGSLTSHLLDWKSVQCRSRAWPQLPFVWISQGGLECHQPSQNHQFLWVVC